MPRPPIVRRRYEIRGQVQGVGFRPFVYRLASAHGLAGFVRNSSRGAAIEAEGPLAGLETFERQLAQELPPLARITALVRTELTPRGELEFTIRASEREAGERPEVTPDAATCDDCLRELFDPADRRYRYPFINCTNCGPRYSIIRGVPYDRPQTTMAVFRMCPACAREYGDPADRRFHAQPNACPACGPRVRILGGGAEPDFPSVQAAARLLSEGAIVAVKGIGGYHLACRADRAEVVARLRERKLRDGKPLALMVPDLHVARRLCRLSAADVEALSSAAAPIVLAPQADGHGLASGVAPGCPDFGLMLPYAPLHHLLFAAGLGPLVMTSANLAGQPLTYRDADAQAELGEVADAFLVHDREIFRPVDDSVVFTFRGETIPLRRARGYAPRPVRLAPELVRHGAGRRILATGGELKSTACLLDGREAILTEHLGDLTRPETFRHFVSAVERLRELCAFEPECVACDLHPHYLASRYARELGLPLIEVQHHHAHIASVMAEWGECGPVIGLSCDGTGYGTDGAVWGCEVLWCDRAEWRRLGHLAYFPLVGGDAAALETWRPAAALLRAACGISAYSAALATAPEQIRPAPEALRIFEQQLTRGLNSPPCSSLGRVFDAVAYLLGLCGRNRHEAEGAMAVEAAAAGQPAEVESLAYSVRADRDGLQLVVAELIRDLLRARGAGESVGRLAARFHEAVARMLAEAADRAAGPAGVGTIALSGGCFANRRLLTRLVELIEGSGRRVIYHRQVPSGDGGLALGQAAIAAWGGTPLSAAPRHE